MPGMHDLNLVPNSPLMILSSFLGITAEEDYGGLAMGYQAHCIVMEEISRASGKPTKHCRCSSEFSLL